MRHIVKTTDGELTYGSMTEIKVLYEQGFISPEDLIRPEDSTRWIKAEAHSVLRGAQSHGKTHTAMGLRIAIALCASVVLAGIAEHERWLLMLGLVSLGVVMPFFIYQKRR